MSMNCKNISRGALMLALFWAFPQVQAQDAAEDPYPFKPGPNAMLVKKTCSQCHSPNVVVTQTFTVESARKTYRKMMGESPDTERGMKIVEYLSTVMGEEAGGN
jgi:mono/diheme cytochrome c family protein